MTSTWFKIVWNHNLTMVGIVTGYKIVDRGGKFVVRQIIQILEKHGCDCNYRKIGRWKSVCVKIGNVMPHLCIRNELNQKPETFEG